MNVLIACEESQAVCKAFRKRGHRAFSADIQECSGGHPEWHIFGDVLFMSRQAITDRCNGDVKKPFGKIDFAWDDSETSRKKCLERLKRVKEEKSSDAERKGRSNESRQVGR